MKWLNKLYKKTVEIAKLYTGTFIVIMILNQLLFFGFCLNPICLIAAMPHVLLLTVIFGTFIAKIKGDEKKSKNNSINSKEKEFDEVIKDFDERIEESLLTFGVDKNFETVPKIVPSIDDNIELEAKEFEKDKRKQAEERAKNIPCSNELGGDISVGFECEYNNIVDTFLVSGIEVLYHITHIDNLDKILKYGIFSHTEAHKWFKPEDISMAEAQRYRTQNEPVYNRSIHEYAPLYIQPKNPMLYYIKEQQSDLCILEIDINILRSEKFVFTDGNAASKATNFFKDIDDINKIPTEVLFADYWNDYPDGKRERCAEVLIFPKISTEYINTVHCNNNRTKQNLSYRGIDAEVTKELYF